LIFAFCLLIFHARVAADFDPKKWAKWREINVADKNAPADFVQIELDGPVFAGARSDLADLRVIDEQGIEVPSKLIVQRDEVREEQRPLEVFDRALAPDGRLSFTLDLGADPPRHNRLNLETTSHNFSRRVTVEASDDNRQWVIVRDDGYIFDFTRDRTVRFLTIDYPLSTRRYLRVTIWNHNEPPVEIAGVSVFQVTELKAHLNRWPATLADQGVDAKLRASIWMLDLGYQKVPSTRLEFQPVTANFQRRVEIEGSNEGQTWLPVGNGEIFAIGIEQRRRQHLQLDYREAQFRYLRIKVFNYDDSPIKLAEVRVYGYPRYLLFRREQGRSYRLFYGNPSAAAPHYDLEQLSPYLQLEQLSTLSLSAEQTNPEAGAPWFERQPLWLWAVFVIAAAVLGAMILRLAKLSTGSGT
jgi:hypothetical protein